MRYSPRRAPGAGTRASRREGAAVGLAGGAQGGAVESEKGGAGCGHAAAEGEGGTLPESHSKPIYQLTLPWAHTTHVCVCELFVYSVFLCSNKGYKALQSRSGR